MKRILLPALFAFSFGVHAQLKRSDILFQHAVHFNPLALAEIDYTILVGAEYRLKPKLGIILEGGYIFASNYLTSLGGDLDSRASGFIIRPAMRFYHGYRNAFYFQPQVFYKQVTNPKYDWLGKDCVNHVPTYESLQDFKYRRHVVGVNAVVGRLVSVGKEDKSFVDFFLGVGIRFKKSAIVDEPRSCYEGHGSQNPDEGFFISVPAGLKFVFKIN